MLVKRIVRIRGGRFAILDTLTERQEIGSITASHDGGQATYSHTTLNFAIVNKFDLKPSRGHRNLGRTRREEFLCLSLPVLLHTRNNVWRGISNTQSNCQSHQEQGSSAIAMVLSDVPKTMSRREWIQMSYHERVSPPPNAALCRESQRNSRRIFERLSKGFLNHFISSTLYQESCS